VARATALATALGVNLGVAVWVVAAALGLAAAVQASQTLFDVLRLAGAAYLILLGIRSLVGSRAPIPADATVQPAHQSSGQRANAFRQGLASNLLNPKMALLFTSLLPQFIERGTDPLPGLLMLGAVFNVLGVVWLTAFALVVARSRHALARPRVRRVQEWLTGGVLIGLGVRVALERR
jgi:threonine/homoserine/homoserine lactone efflux protein